MIPFIQSAFAQSGQGGALPSTGQGGTTTGGSIFDSASTSSGLGVDAPTLISSSPILGELSFSELIQMIIVYAFIIAAALSAIFIFIGGINFILSGGADDKIKQAVNTIRYSIIGLIVTILSFTFVTIIGRIFGIDFLGYVSYDSIRDSINQLTQSVQVENPSIFSPQ